jgi:hypothetical protein
VERELRGVAKVIIISIENCTASDCLSLSMQRADPRNRALGDPNDTARNDCRNLRTPSLPMQRRGILIARRGRRDYRALSRKPINKILFMSATDRADIVDRA